PVVQAVTKTADTFCSNTGNTGDGAITINITDDGAPATLGNYSVEWYRGTKATNPGNTDADFIADDIVTAAGANAGTAAINGGILSLQGLATGTYTVFIDKNNGGTSNLGCLASATFNIVNDRKFPVINIPETQLTANTTCVNPGNGSISLKASNIKVGGVAQNDLANYDITITSTSGFTIDGNASPYTPVIGVGTTSFAFGALSADNYLIKIENKTTGCPSTSYSAVIIDDSQDPIIDEFVMTPNSNCTGGTVALGTIEITSIDGAAPSAGSYTYKWYAGTSATLGQEVSTLLGETDDAVILENMVDGFYTVEITNTDPTTNTSCNSTQTIEIQNDPEYPIISSYEVNKNLTCFNPGNGSYVVTKVKYQGNTLSMGNSTDSTNLVDNFTLALYNSAGIFVKNATEMKISDLDAGVYFAGIYPNESNCESQRVQFQIFDNKFFPEIQIVVLEADSTCSTTGTTPNGSLLAIPDNANNPIHIDSSYIFNWYQVDASNNRLSGSISLNDTLTSQYAGRFEVEVTNKNVGCTSSAFLNLNNVPEELRITAIDSVSATTCSPSNAFFEVTKINVGNLTDYTFNFYNDDPTVGNPNDVLVYSGASAILSFNAVGFDVVPGDYYVIATSNLTSCSSGIYQITIEDKTTPPDILLDEFTLQLNCDPTNPSGSLTVISTTADGSQDNALFNFQWIAEIDGSEIEPDNAFVGSLPAGDYTVNVTEIATGCVASETYTMIDDLLSPIPLHTQTSSNKYCENPNGQASVSINMTNDEFVNVRGKSISDFGFHWYTGDQTNNNNPDLMAADTISTLYIGLTDGVYSVYAIDLTDPGCGGTWAKVTIKDATEKPDFRIDIINNVTICDPDRPDGRAQIGAPTENKFKYQYDWYAGTDTTGMLPIKTDSKISNLAIGDYLVVITDLETGCRNMKGFKIGDATEAIPEPSIFVLQHRTNCQFPDGRARASVSGETAGYEFNWVLKIDPTVIVFTGDDISTLDSTTYLVTATDLATGCVSAPSELTILNNIVDPTFSVRASSSICLRTEDGSTNQFNGTAEIVFSEDTPSRALNITWTSPYGGNFDSNDPKLVDAAPGIWNVGFEALNGCIYSTEFEIETAIKIYNGVSANNDGNNDFFLVDCIDIFPENKVTIFNRDGTSVYEIKSYDNFDRRFDGISNVGKSGMKLPTGTYFYIIEKGDGSDPIQGYLELVR
ncbi:MAG: gliding motility-associated-like protein, partial [Cyclobacteriaceae bacterium]